MNDDGSWKEYEEVSFGDFGNKEKFKLFSRCYCFANVRCRQTFPTSLQCVRILLFRSLVRSNPNTLAVQLSTRINMEYSIPFVNKQESVTTFHITMLQFPLA